MGKGVGDLNIKAKWMSLIQSFVIIDGLYAHINEIVENQTNTSNVLHNVNVDSNLSLQLPTNFELTMKVKSTMTNSPRFGLKPVSQKDSSNPNYLVMVEQTSTTGKGMHRNNSNLPVGSVSIDGTSYQDWKIEKQGNVFKWYLNEVQIGSDVTLSWFDTNNPYLLAFYYWQGGTMYVKDLVIKPL